MSTQAQAKQQKEPEGFSIDHNFVPLEAWETLDHWLKTDHIRIQKTDTSKKKTPMISSNEIEKEQPQQEQEMEYHYYKIPWQDEGEKMQHRRIAQFGCRYDYQTDIVDTQTPTNPIPHFLKDLLLTKNKITSSRNIIVGDVTKYRNLAKNGDDSNNDEENNSQFYDFNQCIINEYTTHDTIIPWHKDHPDFGPTILVYTFGDDRPLHFRKIEHKEGGRQQQTAKNLFYQAHPNHCSRYILKGEARNDWEHSVPRGKGRRVSFTFRTLL